MKKIIILFTASLMMFASCKKNSDDFRPVLVLPVGAGAITFVLKPEHHGKPIPSSTAYADLELEFNTIPAISRGEYPALYDLIAVGTDGSFEVLTDSMKCEIFYLHDRI